MNTILRLERSPRGANWTRAFNLSTISIFPGTAILWRIPRSRFYLRSLIICFRLHCFIARAS